MDKSIYYGKQGWDKIVNKKVEFIIYDFLVFIRLFSHSSWWDGDEFTVEWNKFDDDVIDVSFHWIGVFECRGLQNDWWHFEEPQVLGSHYAGRLRSKQKLWNWRILD